MSSVQIIKTFEILSFELTDNFLAVFAEVASDGYTDLHAEPVDAIGLANVTERYIKEGVFDCAPEETYKEFIGLMLCHGAWEIADECSNFSGLMRVGGNIWEATAYLDRSEYKMLRKSPAPQGDGSDE